MKKFLAVIFMLAVTLIYCNNAGAVEAGIGKGSQELAALGGFINLSGKAQGTKFTSNTTIGMVQYGYFITDQIQLGGDVLYMGGTTKVDDEKSSSNTIGADLNAKYHFISKGQSIVPYLGIQAGYLDLSAKSDSDKADGNAFSYGGMGGVKFFITEKTSFNAEVNYRRYRLDVTSSGTKVGADINQLMLLLGFSVYFGK